MLATCIISSDGPDRVIELCMLDVLQGPSYEMLSIIELCMLDSHVRTRIGTYVCVYNNRYVVYYMIFLFYLILNLKTV